MSADTFSGISRPGYDVMVVWDYRSFYIDWSCVEPYSEICLLAWSMGVFAASQTAQAIDYKITKRIAVNGTLCPIDSVAGIPEHIYYGTLDNLSETGVRKFNRRMCASREMFDRFMTTYQPRAVDELADELRAIAERTVLPAPAVGSWDLAIIGKGDCIFPPINQQRAWTLQRYCGPRPVAVEIIDDGHYTDFQAIIDRYFVDKDTMQQRFAAGTATYAGNSPVQADVVSRLCKMLKTLRITSELASATTPILEIGSGAGNLSRCIRAMAPNAKFTMWDIAADAPFGVVGEFQQCDAELQLRRIAPQSQGFIFSASTMQWFNSPVAFLENCARALKPAGYACLTTYTRGNMHEITDLTGNSLPLYTPAEWLKMVSANFEVLASQAYERDLDFETPLDVLRHLKLSGVNSLGKSSRGDVDARSIINRYPMRLDGRFYLTYKPLIMVLQKK